MVLLKLWIICAASLNIAAFLVDTVVDLAFDDPFIKIPVVQELTINSLIGVVHSIVWLIFNEVNPEYMEDIVYSLGFLGVTFSYWYIHNRIYKNKDLEFNWIFTVAMIGIANLLIMLLGHHFEVI